MIVTGVRSWIQGARPKTLTAALVPVLVASALSWLEKGGAIRAGISLLALLSALFIQIGTNLLNDALDFRKGTDTAERIGPVRITQSGKVSAERVLAAGFLALAIAAIMAVPLLIQGGWPILVIGLLSLACGYLYTGGPYPLAYVGLGDLFVFIFFGLVAVGGLCYLQSGSMSAGAWLAGAQIGLLATVMIVINNFRDRANDDKSNKRTLAVRFGDRFSRLEITLLLLVPFALGIGWLARGWMAPCLLPLLALVPALGLIRDIYATEPGPAYNRFLARASGIHLLFGLLLSAAFWFEPGFR